MAIDQSKYPKTTNYDLFTYDGNSYANFVETLTPNFNKIDDQMKKNEDAASSKNQQIDEISTTVEQINQELPQIRENAEHAASDASAALTSATAASKLAQTANTTANSAVSSVGTVATDLAELTSTVNTNTTNIQTNARNIQGFEESINTVNENYTNVNGKLTTTIANVQKLKTGFDDYVISKDVNKTVNVVISKFEYVYSIRISAASASNHPFLFHLQSSTNVSFEGHADVYPAVISSTDVFRYPLGICNIFNNDNDVRVSGLAFNDSTFIFPVSKWNGSVGLENITFQTNKCVFLSLPPVSITNID